LLVSLASAYEAGVLKEVMDELNPFCGCFNDFVASNFDETEAIADTLKESGWLTKDGKVRP
jgi:hypothetical protein